MQPKMSAYTLEGASWATASVTWSFATATYPSDAEWAFSGSVTDPRERALVAQAFAKWASVSGLHFVQVDDAAQSADIRVGFGDFGGGLPNAIGVTHYRTDAAGHL